MDESGGGIERGDKIFVNLSKRQCGVVQAFLCSQELKVCDSMLCTCMSIACDVLL